MGKIQSSAMSSKLNFNVGNVGDMLIDTSRLVGQDAAGNMTSSGNIILMAMVPNDYGFVNIYVKQLDNHLMVFKMEDILT